MEIKLIASSDAAAGRAENAALAEIRRLNSILSGYDPSSEFSRWAATQGQPVKVSPELVEVLGLWDSWRARTAGALNPAAETVGRVWKNAETAGSLPDPDTLAAAASAAGETHWRLDPAAGTATHLTTTPLRLNSFTKSYIIERAAAAALHTPGVTATVVNIGGDIAVRGSSTDLVNVADPRSDSENSAPIATLAITDRAVATSGDYRRGYEIAGHHYSHIVDPRTGQTADAIASATVIAPRAVDAGALATAFCVVSPEESRKFAASVPGAEYLLVTTGGERIASRGWNTLQAPAVRMVAAAVPQQAKSAAPAAAAGPLWDPAYDVTVTVQLPQPQGYNVRRPYLAVWIEDKDRFPVRTIAVWFNKMKYLNELRAWYRGDRVRSMAEGNDILNSVTSATRSPGKYTFTWDGKDNAGKPVKAGKYTILVEAAREHGGYSLDRRELDCNGQPSQADAPPDAELGPVTFEYHKASH
jgi:thiamine biosynthesis lipoprotein ApbE